MNEKRDEMIFLEHAAEEKNLVFPELKTRKKDRGFFSEEEKKPK
jgi:hypothetical protein